MSYTRYLDITNLPLDLFSPRHCNGAVSFATIVLYIENGKQVLEDIKIDQ